MTPGLLLECARLFSTEADARSGAYSWPPRTPTPAELADAEDLVRQADDMHRRATSAIASLVAGRLRSGARAIASRWVLVTIERDGYRLTVDNAVFEPAPPTIEHHASAEEAALAFVSHAGAALALEALKEIDTP